MAACRGEAAIANDCTCKSEAAIASDCMRLLDKFLFFISSHRYCAAMMQTIVYEGIGLQRG
jgi:hypothetical protein